MIRFKKILCPTDFLKISSRAFDYAVRLAGHYDAKVHALHVVEPVMPAHYGMPFSIQDLTSDLKKESEKLLKTLQARGLKARVPVSTTVQVGDVDREILRSIAKEKADLVVMGTHGRRGFERLLLGSVTERMLRHCPVPLLAVGPGRKAGAVPPAIRRILFTTDFSPGSADAVKYALSLARECDARLTLLHVLNDVASDLVGRYRDPLVRGIETELQSLVPQDALDWCDAEIRVVTGLPFKVIPNIVKSGAFDLLVMNIHGKSLSDRVLIGSTAERTLRAAAGICPVLLVPPLQSAKKKRGAA